MFMSIKMVFGKTHAKRVKNKLLHIIAKYTDVKIADISLDSKLREDLGISSFDTISIVFELEQAFCIDLKDWDANKIPVTVNDIYLALIEKLE